MLLLGIDVGRTEARVVAVTKDGEITAEAESDYTGTSHEGGWEEQNPGLWWDGVVAAIRIVVAQLGPRVREIKAVGLSGQPNMVVLLDQMAQIIRLAMVGGPDLPTKLAWIAQHEPDRFDRIAQALPAKDFIRFKMSGVYATDVTEAVHATDLQPKWLPKVYEASAVTSQVIPGIGALTGLPMWIPIIAGTSKDDTRGVGAALLAAEAVK